MNPKVAPNITRNFKNVSHTEILVIPKIRAKLPKWL